MYSINMSSISAKIGSFISSNPSTVANMVREKAEKIANEAGEQLVSCIRNAISASGLNGGAIAAVGDVSSTSAVELAPGKFQVDVSIDAQSRPSLVPDRYGGVDDMASLLDRGYSAGARVYGYWHGNYTGSLQQRDGAHFVQSGVDTFNATYGGQYNAVATIVSDRFG